eukprot:6675282-Pyramimonas_sp.AAC.1
MRRRGRSRRNSCSIGRGSTPRTHSRNSSMWMCWMILAAEIQPMGVAAAATNTLPLPARPNAARLTGLDTAMH